MRAGAHVLSLLALPLNVHVLEVLNDEPRSLIELRRAVGSPPQTTMRGHLRNLTEAGILDRRRRPDFPGSVDFELTAPGVELLEVAEVVRDWLRRSSEGPLDYSDLAAKTALKALIQGWSSGIVRVLAARPMSLTELNGLITGLNYPSLERRLGAMKLAGQIEACPGEGRGTPYVVTDWLRRAIGPLTAGARWERRHLADAVAPVGRIDVEAALLLTVPTLRLPGEISGRCRLAVEFGDRAGEAVLAGVDATVEAGRVVSCVSRLKGPVECSALGSVTAWIDAVADGEREGLELAGERGTALALVEGLHEVLFAGAPRS